MFYIFHCRRLVFEICPLMQCPNVYEIMGHATHLSPIFSSSKRFQYTIRPHLVLQLGPPDVCRDHKHNAKHIHFWLKVPFITDTSTTTKKQSSYLLHLSSESCIWGLKRLIDAQVILSANSFLNILCTYCLTKQSIVGKEERKTLSHHNLVCKFVVHFTASLYHALVQ